MGGAKAGRRWCIHPRTAKQAPTQAAFVAAAHQAAKRTNQSCAPAPVLILHSWRAVLVFSTFTMITLLFLAFLAVASASDLNRQSIIFNENTPDVFYCPQVQP